MSRCARHDELNLELIINRISPYGRYSTKELSENVDHRETSESFGRFNKIRHVERSETPGPP